MSMSEYYGADFDDSEEDDGAGPENFWDTKDGRQLLITEMDDEHLKNTVAYLDRRGASSVVAVLDGNYTPTQYAEARMGSLRIQKTESLTIRRYRKMVAELERRKKDAER